MKKKTVSVLAFSTLAFAMSGCTPSQTINANAINQPLRDVSDRHDAAVNKDFATGDISEVERNIFLRDTELLRAIVDEATSE